MVDIETLGKKMDSTIIQISAIAFDINSGKQLSEFNRVADIEENKEINVCGDTLKWWLNTDKELLSKLINGGAGSSKDVLREFHRWIKTTEASVKMNNWFKDNVSTSDNNIYLWGNGILFDNRMIQGQMENIGLEYPIFYRNDRDVRTIVDLASAKLGISERELKDKYNDDELVKHYALDDVKYQIKLVVGCYKELSK